MFIDRNSCDNFSPLEQFTNFFQSLIKSKDHQILAAGEFKKQSNPADTISCFSNTFTSNDFMVISIAIIFHQ